MQLQLTFPHTELQGAFPANVKNLFYFLEIDTKFADWINRRINHYDFIENQDYIIE
ncbi:antA/AntB antirepressor family protein, partial [Campylobacter jejuni]